MTEDNRIEVKDYWKQRDIVLAFSRQDDGLIAIGKLRPEGGEEWIHLRREDVARILWMSERAERGRKND